MQYNFDKNTIQEYTYNTKKYIKKKVTFNDNIEFISPIKYKKIINIFYSKEYRY